MMINSYILYDHNSSHLPMTTPAPMFIPNDPNLQRNLTNILLDNGESQIINEANTTKLVYPKVYINWDTMLQDGRSLILRGEVSEIKPFKSTVINTFLLQLTWPILILILYLLFQFFYPTFSIWFSWVGILLTVFMIYRGKECYCLIRDLNNPDKSFPQLPRYTEQINNRNSLPPPAYQSAMQLPPAYVPGNRQE
ncbi:hypothetical protein K502DRAFT_350574 [Neoconidiobolus thromboides FSU 785]|nr:hypothetical protein K502DRAFT_350574 [Neoconidiobolus thromboides FSU 785]